MNLYQQPRGLGSVATAIFAFFILFGLVPSLLPGGEDISTKAGAIAAAVVIGYMFRKWTRPPGP
jgi:hypothetical protein